MKFTIYSFLLLFSMSIMAQTDTSDTSDVYYVGFRYGPMGIVTANSHYASGQQAMNFSLQVPINPDWRVDVSTTTSFIASSYQDDETGERLEWELFMENLRGALTRKIALHPDWNSSITGSGAVVQSDHVGEAWSNNTLFTVFTTNRLLWKEDPNYWIHTRIGYQLEREKIQNRPFYTVIHEETNWYHRPILEVGLQDYNRLQDVLQDDRFLSFEYGLFLSDIDFVGIYFGLWGHINEKLVVQAYFEQIRMGEEVSLRIRRYFDGN